jgi:flavin-binding protein dodecin
MSVARVIEISSTSDKNFEDAIVQGIARASKTLREIKSAWVKEQEAQVQGARLWPTR